MKEWFEINTGPMENMFIFSTLLTLLEEWLCVPLVVPSFA